MATSWLQVRRLNPDAAVRIFCFPHAGAGASFFGGWEHAFPPAVEVCPVQLPGREGRLAEPAFRRMVDLVPETTRALLAYLDRPFVFFGHSLGALVAFEIARRLRAEHGREPARLFVSGRGAPHVSAGTSTLGVHALPEREFAERLRELQGTPEEVLQHEELRRLLFPILRADFEVCETYAYAPDEPLRCPIVAFGGTDDGSVSRAALEAWRQQTLASFDVRMFPGDHFFPSSHRSLLLLAVAREVVPLGAAGRAG
jgi:medium-chain acyl-[acyl-carrier-protein] hydrolase